MKLRVNERNTKVMKYTTTVGGKRIIVVLNGELIKETECFQYLGSHVTVIGGILDVMSRMNKGKV